MSNLSCTFCNLLMNSQMQWDDHVVGQKHLRAVKLAEVAAAAVQNLPAPSRTPSPPDSYHGTDMTDAILGSNGNYECRVCTNFSCTGIIPMQDHLKGAKHLKALKNHFPASVISDPCAVLQPDGKSYKCSICDDGAIISGQAPMKQHLSGMKHLKQVQRRNPLALRPLSASPTPISVASAVIKNRAPSSDINMFSPYSPLVSLTAEESVDRAWNHPINCGYMYNDSFSILPLADKIKSLSPHFAFLAHDEPIPNLSKYLA